MHASKVAITFLAWGVAGGTSTLPAEGQGIVYVDDSATGSNNGSSWQNAFTDLQSALEAAENSSGTITEIRVAEGIYKPSRRTDPNDPHSAAFVLPSGAKLFGGFSGTESSSARDWETHRTILSGDLLGDDLSGILNRADNVQHVLLTEDFYPNDGLYFLDGITVRGGYADDATYNFGAGLFAYGTVVLQNCTFEDNWAGPVASEGTVAHSNGGGAVTVFGQYENPSDPHVVWRNCRFLNNSSSGTGGAVFLARTNVDFYDCLFERNTGASGGAVGFEPVGAVSFHNSKFIQNDSEYGPGAIWSAYYIPNIHIIGCEFKANIGGAGGALSFDGAEHFVIEDSVFENNFSNSDGGALNWQGIYDGYYVRVSNCRFVNNRAQNGGGALMLEDGNATVERCVFESNGADEGGAIHTSDGSLILEGSQFRWQHANFGGAILAADSSIEARRSTFEQNYAAVGGAMFVAHDQAPPSSISDSRFSNNWADFYGGAIAGGSDELLIQRSTIAGNSAGALGGGLIAGRGLTIRDSIVWGNVVDPNTGAFNDEHAQIEGLGFARVDYSIVQGWSSGFEGEVTSGLDPLFVAPLGVDGHPGTGDEDFHLLHASPAFNAGDPSYVPEPGDADLDGHARVLCGRVDLGAYESGIGDADCDDIIDLTDFSVWALCAAGLEEAADCTMMDFDNDGDTDLLDFAGMQRLNWGP